MVDLGGYVIVLVKHKGKIKLLGSAAERTDCDEILEINGKSLENATHQEIIQHVHQCIRTRTICLRVKRRTSGKLAIDSSLVDAFVIGSRAREHLHRIARDTSITPRDIAQLSRILSETEDSSRFNQGKDSESASTAVIAEGENKDCPEDVKSAHLSSPSSSTLPPNLQQQQPLQQSSDATVNEPGIVKSSSSGEEERNLIGKLGKSSSGEGEIEYYELSDENMELVELNTKNLSSGRGHIGHHREVPVDVPESFVGIVKQKPRYPPPPQLQQRISVSPPPPPSTLPSSQSTSATITATLNNNTTSITTTNATTKAKSSVSPSSSQTRLEPEKLRKYSEDVTRKKAEEEFLRSSLRNSKKIGHLEHKRQKTTEDIESGPAVNDAFEGDDEVFEQNKILPSIDLNPVLERVVQQLNGELRESIFKTDLTKLVAIYNSIMQQKQKQHSLPCVSIPATDLESDIIMLLQQYPDSSEAAELLEILTRFELEGLCFAFDRIVSTVKDFEMSPVIAHQTETNGKDVKMESEDALNSGLDPNVRVVRIEKSSSEPLGATVRNEPDGSVIIGRIVKGGAAEKSGLLHEGDEILEVNGIEMKGRNVNQVCDLLGEMTGTLTFVIAIRDQIPKNPSTENHLQFISLKALFDYDPDDDVYIPCRELGICFSKGDILHVIDQSDTNWWQAYRDGEQDQSLAGLIPSVHFQLQREAMQQSMLLDSNNTSAHNYKNRANKKSASSILFNCGKRYHNRRKKHRKLMSLVPGADEAFTYEEVSLYYPRANIKRPIILIGPTNIGRHEIRQKLMQDLERFAAAVPHTSRPRRDGEMNGIDYHFISRQAFEQDIKDGKFVEHGQFEKNYYGTSLSAIEAVVQSGKICVLNMHVQSIPILRQGHAGAKLKPYFVLVAPPTNIESLRKLISTTYKGQEEGSNLSPCELQSIIDEARDIETRFGHYFDKVLPITDIDQAYQELLREINKLEREPQWIPSIWNK